MCRVCLFVPLGVCLPQLLSVSLFSCLAQYMPVCLLVCLAVCFPACLVVTEVGSFFPRSYMLFYIHETVEFTVGSELTARSGFAFGESSAAPATIGSPSRTVSPGAMSPRRVIPDSSVLHIANDHTYSRTPGHGGRHSGMSGEHCQYS